MAAQSNEKNTEYAQIRVEPEQQELLHCFSLPKKKLPESLAKGWSEELFSDLWGGSSGAEALLLDQYSGDIAESLGEGIVFVEPCTIADSQAQSLIRALKNPKGHVFSGLGEGFTLPAFTESDQKRVVYLSGAVTAGNPPLSLREMVRKSSDFVGAGGGILICAALETGLPLPLSRASAKAVSGTHSKILVSLNKQFSGSFEPSNFSSQITQSKEGGRIETHLVSQVPQLLRLSNTLFTLRQGENIHIADFYRYREDEIIGLCESLDFQIISSWVDEDSQYAIYYLERAQERLNSLVEWVADLKNLLPLSPLWKGMSWS